MIYTISDSHFYHQNITGQSISKWSSGYRNFSSIEEMNTHILNGINNVVQKDDTLIFGGDFAFGDHKKIPEIRQKIKCENIIFLFGNHDKRIRQYYQHCFTKCYDYYVLDYKKQRFIFSHYPIYSWEDMKQGSILIFGHVHNKLTLPETHKNARMIEVTVEALDYKPISLDEIILKMKDRKNPDLGNH